MKKIILSALVAGIVLLILSILGLYITIWFFPGIASQYFDPAFATQSSRIMIFYLHPFVLSLALSWFWSRFKDVLSGSFFTRGVEFALIYVFIAVFPMMWFMFSMISISFEMIATWFMLSLVRGVIAGLIFEKMNP